MLGGVTVYLQVGNEKIPLDKKGNEIITKFWLPMAQKVLLNLMLYGMSPVTIVTEKDEDDNDLTFPIVPKDGN
jgi:hypothetical protein